MERFDKPVVVVVVAADDDDDDGDEDEDDALKSFNTLSEPTESLRRRDSKNVTPLVFMD